MSKTVRTTITIEEINVDVKDTSDSNLDAYKKALRMFLGDGMDSDQRVISIESEVE
jgi:hypothetical protein